ncbi:MAG: hypothetical protein ACJ8CN_06825, partial [Gemmatimonadales bacterium]
PVAVDCNVLTTRPGVRAEVSGCRVPRNSVATIPTFFVAVRSGMSAVPDSARGGGIRDCF